MLLQGHRERGQREQAPPHPTHHHHLHHFLKQNFFFRKIGKHKILHVNNMWDFSLFTKKDVRDKF